MFVKPGTEGLMVLDPVSYQYLPAEGAEKPEDAYWVRRLKDGDVVLASDPAAVPVGDKSTSRT